MVDRKDSSAGTGIYAGFVAVLVVVGGLIALVAQNTESVTVRWLGLEWTAPLTAVLLSAVLATVVIMRLSVQCGGAAGGGSRQIERSSRSGGPRRRLLRIAPTR
ncbi:MAG: hypothetical protein HKO82_12835 [Acidimicrobiia bacterium]|nr:hypothetical protein [Acidimicrobiia bacterium]